MVLSELSTLLGCLMIKFAMISKMPTISMISVQLALSCTRAFTTTKQVRHLLTSHIITHLYPTFLYTAKGIEYMIGDALLSAEGVLKLAERIFDPKKYLYLTDGVMHEIESSERPVRLLHQFLHYLILIFLSTCRSLQKPVPSSSESESATCTNVSTTKSSTGPSEHCSRSILLPRPSLMLPMPSIQRRKALIL